MKFFDISEKCIIDPVYLYYLPQYLFAFWCIHFVYCVITSDEMFVLFVYCVSIFLVHLVYSLLSQPSLCVCACVMLLLGSCVKCKETFWGWRVLVSVFWITYEGQTQSIKWRTRVRLTHTHTRYMTHTHTHTHTHAHAYNFICLFDATKI